MNNRRFGAVLVVLGLLSIAAALFLYGYNRDQERRAGEAAVSALEEVTGLLKSQGTPEREVIVLEDSEPLPENTQAAPGSVLSYVSEQAGEAPAPTQSPQAIPAPPEDPPDLTNTAETGTAGIEPTSGANTPEPEISRETAPEAEADQTVPLAQPADGTPAREQTIAPTEETVPEGSLPEYLRYPEMEMPEKIINGYAYIGTLDIPALSLSLPVMSGWSYKQLNYAPCRFSGSAYMDDFVVIAHNYATHFGRIKELRPGDEVIFTDMSGNALRYAVVETEILGPDDVDKLVDSGYALTLLTCTVGGRTRVTVRCDRVLD